MAIEQIITPAPETLPHEMGEAWEASTDMESDILDIRRWARVLGHIENSPHRVEDGDIHVVCMALSEIGKRLEVKLSAAINRIAEGRAVA